MGRFDILKGIVKDPVLGDPLFSPVDSQAICPICTKPIGEEKCFKLDGNFGLIDKKGLFGGLFGSNHMYDDLRKGDQIPPEHIYHYQFHSNCFINELCRVSIGAELDRNLMLGDEII